MLDNEEVVESEEEEIEESEDESLEEDSVAQNTLRPNSAPVNDPKSRIEMMKNVVGALASASSDELCKWHEKTMAQFGHYSDGAPNSSDKNKDSIGAKSSNAVGHNDGSGTFKMPPVKEDLEVLFNSDTTLTEEAKERISTLFEAAVSARVILEKTQLEEDMEDVLVEAINEIREDMEDKLDSYLSYCAEKWLEENQVAIESTLRNELAEEFIEGLKDLFEAHFINIPSEKTDVVDALQEKTEELETALSEAIDEINELKGIKTEVELDEVFDHVAEGLAESQKEKLATLAEGIEFDSIETFEKKLKIVKESYFPGTVKDSGEDDNLETNNETITEEVDPHVDIFAKALNRPVL